MSNQSDNEIDTVLDDDIVQWLAEGQEPTALPADGARALRNRVLNRIAVENEHPDKKLFTLKADQGIWIDVRPKMQMKILHEDAEAGIQGYLLRLEAGFEMSPHEHTLDEECLVLEGDVSLGSIKLKAGDFHFAPKGISHGIARSEQGAMLYIRGASQEHRL